MIGKQSRSARRYSDDGPAVQRPRAPGRSPRMTPVQRRYGAHGGGRRDPEAVQAEAAAGVSGGGTPLPHRETIQKAFGSFDVSSIGAHVGGAAADAADAIGAEAYATGDQVAFRDAPDLHTAAHEAAHVVQQQAGVQLLGGVGEAGDAYERHADAVADRVVAGESAEDLLAAGPGRGGATAAIQRKEPRGKVYSVNFDPEDPLTGLRPEEERALEALRKDVSAGLAGWRAARVTPELGFRSEAHQLSRALSRYRMRIAEIHGVSTVMNWHPALRAAAEHLRSDSYLRYMQEIRVFNPGSLGDYQQLLLFEDLKATHSYQIQPVIETTTGGGAGGASVGYSSKTLVIHYASKELGLSWKQTVKLTGFKLSFAINKGVLEGGGASVGSSVQPPGDPSPAQLQPDNAYVPPSFFGTASYTQVGASGKLTASAGAGPGAKAGGSAGGEQTVMVISNPDRFDLGASTKLIWDSGFGWSVEAGGERDIAPEPEEDAGGLDLDASIGGDVASWSGELDGEATLKGDLGEVEDTYSGKFLWTPLHMARIYFATGESRLSFDSLRVLTRLVREVKKRDEIDKLITTYNIKKPWFKVEIVGGYSNRWSQYDPEIQRLTELEESGRASGADLRKKEELECLEQAENEALAFDRAEHAREAMYLFFGTEGIAVARKALPDDFDCQAPLDEEPGEDKDEDRFAEVRVSGKFYYPTGA